MAGNKMRTRLYCLQLLILLTFGFGSLSAASAQRLRPRTANSKSSVYAFVNPNTRENLTLEEAQAGLNSVEEKRLIEETRQIACRLRKIFVVNKAVGSWSDGAEYSTVIRARINELSLRYACSWLGKYARQKAILYFHLDKSGGARMYVLVLPGSHGDLASIAAKLNLEGIENRTLMPRKKSMLVYIVDLKNELRSKVSTAARRLHARFSSLRGKGEFIGDDDRNKAQKVFDQEILRYESAHPQIGRWKHRCERGMGVSLMGLAREALTINVHPLPQTRARCACHLGSTPRPKGARLKLDAIGFVIHAPFHVAKLAVKKNPGAFKMACFFATIFGDEKQFTF